LGYAWKVPARPNDAQWARWIFDFLKDFAPLAIKDETVRWIVIDSLNSVPLAQSANDFLKALARRISVDLTQFRLILLGYQDTLRPSVVGEIEEEPLAAIGP